MFINNYFGEYFILFSIFLSINLPPSLNPFLSNLTKQLLLKPLITAFSKIISNHPAPNKNKKPYTVNPNSTGPHTIHTPASARFPSAKPLPKLSDFPIQGKLSALPIQ